MRITLKRLKEFADPNNIILRSRTKPKLPRGWGCEVFSRHPEKGLVEEWRIFPLRTFNAETAGPLTFVQHIEKALAEKER